MKKNRLFIMLAMLFALGQVAWGQSSMINLNDEIPNAGTVNIDEEVKTVTINVNLENEASGSVTLSAPTGFYFSPYGTVTNGIMLITWYGDDSDDFSCNSDTQYFGFTPNNILITTNEIHFEFGRYEGTTVQVTITINVISNSYYACSWNGVSNAVVKTLTPIPNDAKNLSDYISGDTPTLGDGWYMVANNLEVDKKVTCTGDVNLILCDNTEVEFQKGLIVNNGNSLNIYSQSYGDDMGKLAATGTDKNVAGIGGIPNMICGHITIHGGDITATGGEDAAGIGGGGHDAEESNQTSFSQIMIYDGIINAKGGENAAGIGCGDDNYNNAGQIYIYGGKVTAEGGEDGAGIGGGELSTSKSYFVIQINGGAIEATGNGGGKGIGSGENDINGNIYLGWSKTTDYIQANSYGGGPGSEIHINGNQAFYYIHDNTYHPITGNLTTPAAIEAIGDKKLMPAVKPTYIDEDGVEQNSQIAGILTGSETVLTPGWYVVEGTLNYFNTISATTSGNVHLILSDDAKMNFNIIGNHDADWTHAIYLLNANLHIYGQSASTGELNLSIVEYNARPAIRAIDGFYSDVTINGGKVTVEVRGYNDPTGIYAGNVFTINGGNVVVSAQSTRTDSYANAKGIHSGGNTIINGGNVHASATGTVSGNYYGIYSNSGDINLSWRNPQNSIYASSYYYNSPENRVIANKSFADDSNNSYSGTLTSEQVAAIADKTLQPAIVRAIEGYGDNGDNNDKWAFIASPVNGSIAPSEVGNLLGEQIPETSLYDFDLYRLNNTTWENYHQHTDGFTIANGTGYLYASKEDKNLVFTGTFNTENSKTIEGLPAGYNLVGNPFTVDAYVSKPYYTLNGDGSAIVAQENSLTTPIAPCYGIIVEVEGSENVIFSTTPSQSAVNNGNLEIALSQANTRGNALIDNAIVSFNEGEQLGKFYFGTQSANIYLAQDGEDYAIAYSDMQGEMPLYFNATEDGEYTLSINLEGVEMNYLHLIDNMTGADIDLLANPSYTFNGMVSDYASRFKLVFSANSVSEGIAESANFAFISGGNLIVNGEGTLQMVDMTGRVILCRDAKSCVSTNGMTPGLYVLRLINGKDVKTQKIVID